MPSDQFAYVIGCYYGPRRCPAVEYMADKMYYLKKHLKYLEENEIKDLNKVLIVLNTDNIADEKGITEELIKEFKKYKIETLYKSNINGSYGAWESAIIKLISEDPEIGYALLIEDDYLPSRTDFLEVFKSKFNDRIGYVCQLWQPYTWNEGGGLVTSEVAWISNGMIDLGKAKEVYDKYGCVFNLNNGPSIAHIIYNQIHFLDNSRSLYGITDIREYRTPFKNHENKIIMYGGDLDAVLIPL